jgi:hypothetical protein
VVIMYRKWVAISVPEASVDAANLAAAAMTGEPADLLTFTCKAVDGDGNLHYVTMVPMSELRFGELPKFRSILGGSFNILADRVDGVWHERASFEDWLVQSNLTLIDEEDETPMEHLDVLHDALHETVLDGGTTFDASSLQNYEHYSDDLKD